MLKKTLLLFILSLFTSPGVQAAMKTQLVEYVANGVTMEGFMVYDDAKNTPQPGVMIVPNWMGLGAFAKEKAEKLALDGYVTFAVDVYGKGVRPKDAQEASKFMTIYKDNRPLLRAHMQAAFDKFTQMKQVDPKKVAVAGYCFGGTAALELARAGAPLVGTATFHGGLSNPTPQDAKNIKGSVLVMHGAEDPFVDAKEVAAFKDEMNAAKANLKFVAYPHAVHAFTDKAAGNDNSKGMAYNAKADQASWQEFNKFLKNVLK